MSDHNPILMMVEERGINKMYNKVTFSIHYEDMWSPYEQCQEIVQHEWKVKSNWNCEDLVTRFKKAAKNIVQILLNSQAHKSIVE